MSALSYRLQSGGPCREPVQGQPVHPPDHRTQHPAAGVPPDGGQSHQQSDGSVLLTNWYFLFHQNIYHHFYILEEKLLEKLYNIYKFDFILFNFDPKKL